MASKRGQRQRPQICEHCGGTFPSGAGLALHLRHTRGDIDYGDRRYSDQGLQSRRASLATVRPWEQSPSWQQRGERIVLTCALDGCEATFSVVPSQAQRRRYCSKSHAGRGQAGRRGPLSAAQRAAISEVQKRRYRENPESNPFYGRTPTNYRGFGAGGYVEALGFWVRSSWERRYLLALQEAGIPFAYEPRRFDLGEGRGTYLPDIQLSDDVFVEITGWDKPGKAEKRHMFVAKYGVQLHVVNSQPTPESLQELVDFAKGVVAPHD